MNPNPVKVSWEFKNKLSCLVHYDFSSIEEFLKYYNIEKSDIVPKIYSIQNGHLVFGGFHWEDLEQDEFMLKYSDEGFNLNYVIAEFARNGSYCINGVYFKSFVNALYYMVSILYKDLMIEYLEAFEVSVDKCTIHSRPVLSNSFVGEITAEEADEVYRILGIDTPVSKMIRCALLQSAKERSVKYEL